MKILITGACGFVGSTLSRTWIDGGTSHTLYGLDNFIRPGSEINRVPLQKMGVKLYHGDLRCAVDLERLPAVDVVVDAAANPSVLAGMDGMSLSRQLVEHNLSGTVNLLEFCKRSHAGFILLSSSRVYSIRHLKTLPLEIVDGGFRLLPGAFSTAGVSPDGVAENFSTRPPVSLYGASKIASETLALEYGNAFNFPVWVNRCGVLAGAGQFGRPDQGIISYWIHSWFHRRPLYYTGFDGMGHQVRDCLHPKDLVPLLEKQIQNNHTGMERVQNVSGGTASAFSIRQLSEWCRNRFGARPVQSDPADRLYDVPWLVLDSGSAQAQWNWRPATGRERIFEEIADHAENHPRWFETTGRMS